MNKLWILILGVFISVFSYAEEKQTEEKKCDPAIIDAGVELREAYRKARDSLPESQAYIEARKIVDETKEAYDKALKSFNEASYTFHKALESLPEGQTYDSFINANEGCEQEMEYAYGKRLMELRESRSSRPSQSASSSNSKKSQGSSSGRDGKGVQ